MRHTLLLLVLAACGPDLAVIEGDGADTTLDAELRAQELRGLVSIASWNVEWFGDRDEGPLDEDLQLANVTRVAVALRADLLGLVEVVDEAHFRRLLTALPAYEGLLVTDPRVANGAAYYSASEQKVALLFKRRFTVTSARLVATEAASDFAGRPPMEVQLSFTEGGAPRTLVVVVSHWKAMANYDGWSRRTRASVAYKRWLDATWPSRWVLTIGDFNDDIDASTYQGRLTPFSNFTADARSYRFTTSSLTASGTSTTVGFRSTIDHHLATDELAARFVEGTAAVVRPEAWVPNYALTTSDHYPVLTRYDLR